MAKRQSRSKLQAELLADFNQLLLQEELRNDFEKEFQKDARSRSKKTRTQKTRAARSKKPSRSSSKIKTRARRPRKTLSRITSRKSQGYGKRVNVKKAVHFKKTPRVSKFKITVFKRGMRITAATMFQSLMRILLPIALKHYEALGKVERDLYYIRLYYNHKWDTSRNLNSSFSIGVSRIQNKNQLKEYLQLIIEAFLSSMNQYAKDGVRSVMLKGLETRGWIRA